MMTDRTESGIEFYSHRYMELADQWLEERQVDLSNFRKTQFMDLIYYIHDRMEKVTTNELDKLNNMFDAYVRLCGRFEIIPSITTFAILSDVSRDTFQSWGDGERRTKSVEYVQSYKRWLKVCEGHLTNSIENSDKAPIGQIFSAKCNYQWRETAPITPEELNTAKIGSNNLPNLGMKETIANSTSLPTFADMED